MKEIPVRIMVDYFDSKEWKESEGLGNLTDNMKEAVEKRKRLTFEFLTLEESKFNEKRAEIAHNISQIESQLERIENKNTIEDCLRTVEDKFSKISNVRSEILSKGLNRKDVDFRPILSFLTECLNLELIIKQINAFDRVAA